LLRPRTACCDRRRSRVRWFGRRFSMAVISNANVSGIELEIWAKGAGQTLLFLHPGDGIEPSLPILESLATRYRVVAPSHPGFGGSARVRASSARTTSVTMTIRR
jgi:pimeloyl-ACP methyl ester carboxylesterase